MRATVIRADSVADKILCGGREFAKPVHVVAGQNALVVLPFDNTSRPNCGLSFGVPAGHTRSGPNYYVLADLILARRFASASNLPGDLGDCDLNANLRSIMQKAIGPAVS